MEEIKKSAQAIQEANIGSYEETYKRFRWKDAEKNIMWFNNKTNAAYNAVDRNATGPNKDKVAIYWEGENNEKEQYSFADLSKQTNKFANVLKNLGVKKGDRVFIFLPRIPALFISFLGTLKIGGIAGTMFAAFGSVALQDRLGDSEAKVLVTDAELVERVYPIKKNLPKLEKIIIVGKKEKMKDYEVGYEEEMGNASEDFETVMLDAETPAFMLYTSGTTGKPKGVVHAHAAIIQEHLTAKLVLDLKEDDVYWCVPPNTNIIANPGPRRIEEINVGDRVLTHKGTFCKVLQRFKRKYEGDLVKIKTCYSDEPMLLTPNHSVLSGQRGKKAIRWLPAGNLTKDDFVLFPRMKEVKEIESIDVSNFVKGCNAVNGYAYRSKVRTKIKNKIKIDKKFMKLIGYYIAEGSLSSNNRVIQFSFNKKEGTLAKDVKSLLKDVFSLNSSKIIHKGLLETRANSVIVAELFKKLFGNKACNKKLPEWVLYLADEKLSEFVKGFWLGDGNTDRDSFRFHTTSKKLAYQIKIILSKLGIISSLKCRRKETIPISKINNRKIHAKNDCYCITVGGKSLIKMSEILGKKHPFIKNRWCTYQFGKITNNYIWIPIRQIEKIPYKGYVHNIKTESDSYVLNNMIVHNCTADPGWVTGIAYGILGNLSNCITSVVYSGRFDAEKWYSIINKYKVTVWYTAPTAVRMMMQQGKPKQKINSLRYLCSVGEPLNPEAVKWGMKAFGLAFHDNWWQTETGSILIANYPSMNIRLGSMGKPVPGIKAAIVDDKGKVLPAGKEGNLAIKPGWPSMMRKIWKNPKKYNEYFKHGWYYSGDRASMDKDGYFWFIGRADDVIKTSGERVGPFEVESALIEHKAVAEAAVIGKPDELRGEIIKAFCVLNKGFKPSKELEEELKKFVKKNLAGHAYPREFSFVKNLPKTRSGKIMRRLLKAKETGQPLGDTSTLEDY